MAPDNDARIDETWHGILQRRTVLKTLAAGGVAGLAGCSGGGGGGGGSGGGDGGGGDGGDGGGGDGGDGGGGGGGGGGDGGGGSTVSYMQFSGGTAWDYYQDTIIPQVESETDIDVDASILEVNQYQATLGNYLGTDNAPDIFSMWSGPGRAGKYTWSGDAIELVQSGRMSDEMLDRMEPGMYAYQFEDGNPASWLQGDEYWGVSRDYGGYPVWFNEVVLEEAGVDPDNYRHRKDVTIGEFENLLDQVVNNTDKDGIAAGNSVGGKNAYWGAGLMYKAAGPERFVGAALGQTDAKFTDQVFVDALSKLKEWYDNGYIIRDTNALGEHEANGLFFQNQAAFICDGSWAQAEYRQYADPEQLAGMGESGGWDFFWHPIWPDKPGDYQNVHGAVNLSGYMVTSSAEQRGRVEDAMQVLEYFLKPEHLQQNLTQNMVIPFTSNPEQYEFPNPAVEQMANDVVNADAVVEKCDRLFLPPAASAFYDESQGLFLDKTAEDVLQRTQEATDEALQQYRG
jgi:ABC-type glycerol-3-phosphate transport system substrate-binding protein